MSDHLVSSQNLILWANDVFAYGVYGDARIGLTSYIMG